ncbi:lysoplasmalogenase [Fluviicola sp.]|uniref:lysoplasmalogenase n=1 Tax=Fluviicola sp. TaxID=1917219 RepID=UPI00260DD666|nr:lysoplasmalogenase [Fluviicola sp.]
MKNKILPGILGILFISDLILITQDDYHSLRFFTKPLLVPLITAIYLLGISKKGTINRWFLSGLIFCFLGDTFLLFKWGFLPGLGSFLLAHVLYILSFVKLRKTKMLASIPFILLYLVSLIYFLHPYLKEMEIPVIVYGITISTMAYFSLRSKNKWLITGAFLFVVSDSLLSFNMFVSYSAMTEQFVMATYVFAQLFLVHGMISKKRA